jgi:hypothetical protein
MRNQERSPNDSPGLQASSRKGPPGTWDLEPGTFLWWDMKILLSPMEKGDARQIMDILTIISRIALRPIRSMPFPMISSICFHTEQRVSDGCRQDRGWRRDRFRLLRPYNPLPPSSRPPRSPISEPGFTGQGIGKAILDYLLDMGKERGSTRSSRTSHPSTRKASPFT